MSARPDLASSANESAPPLGEPSGPPLVGLDSVVLRNLQVSLRANLGQLSMTVEDLLALRGGQVVKLDRALGEPIELFLNDTLVARGEIVAVEDNFAVRLTEVASS